MESSKRTHATPESCPVRARAWLEGSVAPRRTRFGALPQGTAAAVTGIEGIPQGINESGTAKDYSSVS